MGHQPRFAFREDVNPDHTQHYVSAGYAGRFVLLAGPYADHETAVARVRDVEARANDLDPRAAFASYGTASSCEIHDTKLGAI